MVDRLIINILTFSYALDPYDSVGMYMQNDVINHSLYNEAHMKMTYLSSDNQCPIHAVSRKMMYPPIGIQVLKTCLDIYSNYIKSTKTKYS